MINTQSFKLDIKNPYVNRLRVVSGDTANRFVITITDDSEPITLDTTLHKVIAVFTRADGNVYAQDSSSGLTFTTGGVVTIDVRPASFRTGTNKLVLQIYKRTSSSSTEYPLLLTTQEQMFQARAAAFDGETPANPPSQLPMLERYVLAAKSYANGNTGTREGEDIDNAEYYKELAEQALQGQIIDPTFATWLTAHMSEFLTAVGGAAEDWLAEHITNPSSPPIDTSLTISGAAADAAETGKIDTAVFATSGVELTNTVGGTEPDVSAGSWFELTNRLEPGDTYKIRLKLAGWSSTQISKIIKVALYWSNSGSSLVDELSFTEELKADEWLSTDAITITGSKSVKYIKLSLAGSYSAGTNSVQALTYRVTDRETYVGRLRNEVEAAERTMTLHPAYYPTSKRYISPNNIWGNQAQKASIFIPVDQAVKLSVTGNATNGSQIALLKSDNSATTGVAPDYVTGWTTPLTIPAGETVSVVIPSEARVIYVANDTSDTSLPSAIVKTIPVNRVSRKIPLFSFMDDDGRQAALDWLEQVVDARRIPISIALITGVVDNNVLFSTWENIRRLRNKGFNFVNHTDLTTLITSQTLETVEQSFKDSQRLMQEHGLPDSDILVLPGGATDADRTALIKNYFRYCMATTYKLNTPPINTWYIPRISMVAYTLAEQKAWVDQAIETNAWCVFYGHAYQEPYTEEKLAEFIELIDYIAAKGGRIVSVPDALRIYGNNTDGDVTYGCDTTY